MQRILTIAIFVLVFALGAAFSAKNTVETTIDYYFSTVSMPLSVVIIVSLVIGILIGASAIYVSNLRLRYENKRLNKKLASSEQELNSLRILPLKSDA